MGEKIDIITFAENYFVIVNLDRGKEIIKLYPAQKRILKRISNNRLNNVRFSRQCGKTTMLNIYALWACIVKNGCNVVIISNTSDHASCSLKGIKLAYDNLPHFLKCGVLRYGKDGKDGIVFDNLSSIKFISKTSLDSNIRGLRSDLLLVDEGSFYTDDELESLFPLFTCSNVSIFSTGKISKSRFLNKIHKNKRKTVWRKAKMRWQDVPYRDEKWKTYMIKCVGWESHFEEEFEV